MNTLPNQLTETQTLRTVGFAAAVQRIGRHQTALGPKYYDRSTVYRVLKGHYPSAKLLGMIAKNAPELLALRFVPESVRTRAAAISKEVK